MNKVWRGRLVRIWFICSPYWTIVCRVYSCIFSHSLRLQWWIWCLPSWSPTTGEEFQKGFQLDLTLSRIPHFHAMHRAMHPWKTTSIPDLGKFLYRQVWKPQRNERWKISRFTRCTTSRTTRQHSPGRTCTPLRRPSTTQLHLFPLPSAFTLLVSSFLSLFRLFFVFFAELQSYLKMLFSLINIIRTNHQSRCFKVHALAVIIDCAMGAWLGHDGFQWPGSGDYFHMLHHKVFISIFSSP